MGIFACGTQQRRDFRRYRWRESLIWEGPHVSESGRSWGQRRPKESERRLEQAPTPSPRTQTVAVRSRSDWEPQKDTGGLYTPRYGLIPCRLGRTTKIPWTTKVRRQISFKRAARKRGLRCTYLRSTHQSFTSRPLLPLHIHSRIFASASTSWPSRTLNGPRNG